MTEIDEESNAVAGRLEIIVRLGSMLVGELFHCFGFNDDLAEADEIGLVFGAQFLAFVIEFQFWLWDKRGFLIQKLNLQTFLENCLKKSTALLPVYFKTSAPYSEGLIFEEKFTRWRAMKPPNSGEGIDMGK